MTNPLADPYLVLIKVYRDGKFLKQSISETPVEPLNKARTVRICYGVLEKDEYLTYVISSNVGKQPKAAVKLVLKIALYMLEFMGKHDYMVVDYAVRLTKKLGKQGASGFVNAFLRSYKIPALPQGVRGFALAHSAPQWLAEKYIEEYGEKTAAQILGAPSHGICVRFVKDGEKYAEGRIKTPFNGVYIYTNFTRDEGFARGEYTFQSVGSVAICEAIEPCENFLDACAAPGGKSVSLSAKCGRVTACDVHPHRVQLIESYVKRMGAENVTALTCDSSIFLPQFGGAFGGVLCDCPCSGTGVINENPDIKLFRKAADVDSLCKEQLKILQNCSRYVKDGGKLYYSTCSCLKEENDGVAQKFLAANPMFSKVEINSPLAHVKTECGLQFLPHISLGAGFYLACFCKNPPPPAGAAEKASV